jgi:trehalose/maltose transport system substrate-binding protein
MITRRALLWIGLGVSGAGVMPACTLASERTATIASPPTVTATSATTSAAQAVPQVGNAAQASRFSGQKVTVSTFDQGNRSLVDIQIALAARFTADTGVQVQILRQSFSNPSEALARYQGLLESKSPDVDVLKIDVVWPGLLANNLVDLNPVLATEARQHYPAIIQNDTVDGRLIGIPWFADFGMLYYRTDLLEKYHFAAPPCTWDELEQQSTAVIEGERASNPKFTGFVYQGVANEALTCNALEWLASSGGGTIVENGAVTINNPRAVAILNRIRGWTGTIAPRSVTSYAEEDARTAFQTGNAAFMRNWPYAWAMGNSPDSQVRGKIAVAPLPAMDGFKSVGTVGGFQQAVNRYSRAMNAAVEWVRYATSPDVQAYQAVAAALVPTIPAVAARPEVQAAEPFLTTLQDVVRVTRPAGIFGPHYDQASALIYRGVNHVLNGQDAGRVLGDLQAQLAALLSY